MYGNPLWFSILLRNPDLTNPKISSTVLPSHTISAVNSHSNSLHTQYIPRWSMTLTSKRATFSIMSHLSALLTFFSSLQIESWVHLWVPLSIFTNFQTRLSSVNSFFKVTSKCSFPLPFYCHHPSPDCHLLNSPFKPSLLFWSCLNPTHLPKTLLSHCSLLLKSYSCLLLSIVLSTVTNVKCFALWRTMLRKEKDKWQFSQEKNR